MTINPEMLFTPDLIPACTQLLGGEFLSYDSKNLLVRIKFKPRPEFCNPRGHVQGGFVTAMLDECFSLAAFLCFEGNKICPTVECKTQFFKPVPVQPLIGEGQIIKQGQSIIFTEATLWDEDGILLAKATATSTPKPFKMPSSLSTS